MIIAAFDLDQIAKNKTAAYRQHCVRERVTPCSQVAKVPADIRSLCRAYTDATVRIVGGIAQNKHTPDSVRIQAIAMLWERGWGRPAQPVTGEDGEGEIKIIIRNIIEEKRLALTAGQVIEHGEPPDDSPSRRE